MKARFINEERSYSQKKIVDSILTPIAEELGIPIERGKKDVRQVMNYTKVTTQYYKMGDLDIFMREHKVPGMGADNPEIWVIDRDDPGKGRRFDPAWQVEDLKKYIASELQKTPDPNPPKEIKMKYDDAQLSTLMAELRGQGISDNEAFDVADGILRDDPDLATYLRVHKGIEDPVGWLANRL